MAASAFFLSGGVDHGSLGRLVPSNRKISPREDEARLEHHEFALWSEDVRKGFLSALEIKPSRKVAVVVAMRDDGVSILEWVAHYRALGFDGIFVYSNDNADGSDDLLRLLADAGVLTFIESHTTGRFSPQRKAFEHSIRLLPELRDFEWVFYADSDEFLDLEQHGQSVIRMLDALAARFPTSAPSAVCYRWKWFVSGGAFARGPGILLTRFQHGNPHRVFKSIVRLRDVVSMCRLHFPDTREPGFFVDANFEPIPESRNVDDTWNYVNAPIRNEGGYIRHYWNKSFEEFVIKKRRGDALGMAENPYQRDFHLFFDWNGPETPDNKDTPSDFLVHAVKREIARLNQIPGVYELDQRLQNGFAGLIETAGGSAALRAIYDEHRK